MQHATYRNVMKLLLQGDTAAQNRSLYICNSSSTAKELAFLFEGYKTGIESWHNQLQICDIYYKIQALFRITHLHLLALRRKEKPTEAQNREAFSLRKQTILLGTKRHRSSTTPLKNASVESLDILRVNSTLSAPMKSFIFKISH